jgi:hypothetical protein
LKIKHLKVIWNVSHTNRDIFSDTIWHKFLSVSAVIYFVDFNTFCVSFINLLLFNISVNILWICYSFNIFVNLLWMYHSFNLAVNLLWVYYSFNISVNILWIYYSFNIFVNLLWMYHSFNLPVNLQLNPSPV